MPPEFSFFPPRGSALAGRVDELLYFSGFIAVFFSLLIAGSLLYLGLKYRRRYPSEVGQTGRTPIALEITWIAIPLAIVLFLFGWGGKVYFELARPPADADQYFVVARQWMWKIQHPDGRREINELHVPLGRPIMLTMTSEDVIHSFFVPAFRVKADVIPGRYTSVWFQASAPGVFHLFCAEYCGTEHSRMIGSVTVMDAFQYEEWLAGSRPERPAAATGEDIFNARACPTCHRPETAARAPILNGLFGRAVHLQGGESVTADEGYIRESILTPAAKVVEGYQPVMPVYQGQLSEDEIVQLIVYIRSLQTDAGRPQ